MKIKISDLTALVLAMLGEDDSFINECIDYGDGDVDLRHLIRMVLPDAVTSVLLNTPLDMIDDCVDADIFPHQLTHGTTDQAIYQLPADFLRLVSIRMSDWRLPVTMPMESDGDALRLRLADSGRMQGRGQRAPAVAIVGRGSKKQMFIFGTAQTSTVSTLQYLARPTTTSTTIELPAELQAGVARRAAEMVRDIIVN